MNDYEVIGMVVFIDGGKSYYLYCKNCYDRNIDSIRKEYGLTKDEPIFRSSESDIEQVCEDCQEVIENNLII